MPSYTKEFPDFGPMDVVIPEGFKDTSWHNDICPSFSSATHKIWVDYANPTDRELEYQSRFTLCLIDADGEYIDTLTQSDDWTDILKALG